MNDIVTLSKTIDLVYSSDDNGFYLQEYKNDGKGTTRTSKIYTSGYEARSAYRDGTVDWGIWE